MVIKAVVILLLVAERCSGVIYHLNESEYERMPPLFGMDSNYHSCLREPGGAYCVAKFELHGDPHNELIKIIREYSEYEIKHYNHSLIDRAVCVTQSCKKFIQYKSLNKTTDLNEALARCVNQTIWTEYGLEAKLADVHYCDKHDDQVLIDVGDWTAVGILLSILTINLIGSAYDVCYLRKYNDKKFRIGNPYLLSFSIFRNWDKLSNTNTNVRYERLKGLHGLKSISTFFVATAHVMWLIGLGYTDNPRDLETSYDYLHYQVIFSGMVIVQIFFVISGCLLIFHLQVVSETKALTWKDVPKILFFRWARLTSANAIVILFTATWFRHLGSGPLWKMFVMNAVTDCKAYWWTHLLYFNNYVPQDKFCAVQTWHVATELQLFLVGLIIYITTAARRRHLSLTILMLVGILAPAMHVWVQDLDALVIFTPEFYRVFKGDTYHFMHVLGHNNISCHAIGMAVGFVSYYCIKHNIEYTNNKLFKLITWCIPACIIGLFLSGNMFYVNGDRPHVSLRMAYAAIQRPALGVMTAMLVLNLVMKFESAIRNTLEWRGWVFTSKLCYSVYLLHVNLIYALLGIVNHFGVVSLTFAASVPFYLIFEAPLTTVTKVFFEESLKPKEKKIE